MKVNIIKLNYWTKLYENLRAIVYSNTALLYYYNYSLINKWKNITYK